LIREINLCEYSAVEEDSSLLNIIDILTGKPYQRLAEKLCRLFKRKFNLEN